ncbi:MAG: NAD(P)/FAD-dependent oxidoreductase [Cyclobacteriaceae bacterium]|nr:NAD(P)/FAD-dependent oxidoreductase [Cyclobacteriaceae bacterium]
MKVAIIGGGAAGFFAAIRAKENYPEADVVIIEKSSKLLSKVKVSGGGRCNVTNGCKSIKQLAEGYPRGGKALKKAFGRFSNRSTMEWFESRGVPLYVQDDNRAFPTTNDSQTIIDCLLREVDKLGVKIILNRGVKGISLKGDRINLSFKEETKPESFDKVIIASGGSSEQKSFDWLENLGHKIEAPVSSLFTFNMPKEPIKKLMGLVVNNALVTIQGTKLKSVGPLLITHWGMSGPGVLKLSAFGARLLADKNYNFKVQVNWVNQPNFEEAQSFLSKMVNTSPQKQLSNLRPYDLPDRLWQFLLGKAELSKSKVWGDLGKKGLNKLINILTNDVYTIQGKTTFKEEFVTCGGLSLESIDMKTMQSKVCKNIYFAGEVMDIDGITGGYNFQAAWTTGYIAGELR